MGLKNAEIMSILRDCGPGNHLRGMLPMSIEGYDKIRGALNELLAKRRELRAALAVVRSNGLAAEYEKRLKRAKARAKGGDRG